MTPKTARLPLVHLPEDVRLRTRVLVDAEPKAGRPYVLYWMRVAVRGHENPALDAAVAMANALGTTVLVYHAVSERYPYASDRHHTFILEGARDVSRELRDRGIAYALHVERPGSRGAFLRELAEGAAMVVTEDAPVPPLAEWTRRLASHLRTEDVPFSVVDASCIVPMPLVTARYDRAYGFRSASRRIASATLARAWHDVEPVRAPSLPALPFTAIDAENLDDRAIASLVAECSIDHGVGPVRDLRGGSVAGYARWRTFREEGLARYAARRNDASIDGTSRLSPWLHFGHVSPLRIAREASRASGAGADKFLDELLVWREVAWHYAAHTPNLESLEALPAWARSTLAAHETDVRETVSMERLERGRTGDVLWDMAQRSLVAHGELHNNVRMTWGKALPAWTSTPEDARRALVDLNHRYALDGRDPASYGGLYWCLGLFDRPFSPEAPVLGTVRPRPTSVHAERLDLEAYAGRAARDTRRIGRVAVIGAGLTGLSCARTLLDNGVDVVVFERSRSPGGRLSHVRATELGVDLGAQYFTARDARFRRFVSSWLDDGLVARWPGRIGALDGRGGEPVETEPLERFVGTPNMNAIAIHLARDLPLRTSHRVDRLERRGDTWILQGVVAPRGTSLGPREEAPETLVDLGTFDALVSCLPPPQAHELLVDVAPTLAESLARVSAEPCVALGFEPKEPEGLRGVPFDGLFVGRDADRDRVLSWVARDSSKPGRARSERWVVHAAPEWSRDHLTSPREWLERALLDELARLLRIARIDTVTSTLRRWTSARAYPCFDRPMFDDRARLGVGGDFTSGGRVEGAFLSGVALAGRIMGLPPLS